MRSSTIIWILLYAATVGGVIFGLNRARERALATYGTADAQSEWERWRSDVRDHVATKGTTQRKVPHSEHPPALVLMRDYFWACLGFALLLSTALFLSTMVVVRGAFRESVIREE